MSPDGTSPEPLRRVDMHFHVGLRGDQLRNLGHISERMRAMRPTYDIFLLYAGVRRGEDDDVHLWQATVETLRGCRQVERVVCLALDHVWDDRGAPRLDLTDFWVSNAYVKELQRAVPEKVLFGASVHPFCPDFRERVAEAVDQEAVLLKWLPSAQQFSLADPRVRDALVHTATAREGKPLPVLLHTGVEYAVPTTDERSRSYDFLSWGTADRLRNALRARSRRLHTPDVAGVHQTLETALRAGAVIIMAHAGMPYFAAGLSLLEHDDFPVVRRYLERCAAGEFAGRVYTDLSACATPFRREYFGKLAKLPRDLLLFGSDFPTPAFELSASAAESARDFEAMLRGDLKRIVIPQDNLIDVNYRELNHFFPGHPMFTNFDRELW